MKYIYKNRLVELREEKNIKQYTLANYLNFHENAYGQFEREDSILPINHLNEICNYFNVSIDYIFALTNEKQYIDSKKDIDISTSIKRLKELRKENNLKIHDISAYLEIDKDLYGKYERQNVIIPIKHLLKVSEYFNVSIDYIFDFSDIKQYNKSSNANIDLLSKRLKEIRKNNNLTQEKLAKEINTNKSVICAYEKGNRFIPTPFLYEICKKYHISADYLLGKIEEPKNIN